MPEGPRSLEHALGPGRLEPHFQAVIECSTGMLRAVEALARWRTGDVLIEGEDLVALAAEADACALLDAEMLRLAVRQVAAWRRLPGLRTLELHANLSPQSLRVPGLAERIQRTCRDAGLDPAALWMEVTETSVIGDLPQAATTLTELRSQGVRIWVDDFGAGYASLAYVKQLPIDGVKIDRSFIADIESSETGRAIVAAVVSLASPLALGVIAEGVESERQADVVRTLGVHATQGFYHGRPQPPSDGIGGLEGSPRHANGSAAAANGTVIATDGPPSTGVHRYRHEAAATALATIREEARLRVVAACSPPLGEYDPVLHEVARFVADVCEVEVAVIGVDDRDRTLCLAQHQACERRSRVLGAHTPGAGRRGVGDPRHERGRPFLHRAARTRRRHALPGGAHALGRRPARGLAGAARRASTAADATPAAIPAPGRRAGPGAPAAALRPRAPARRRGRARARPFLRRIDRVARLRPRAPGYTIVAMRTRLIGVCAIVVALALTLSGCGSGGSSSHTTAAASSPGAAVVRAADVTGSASGYRFHATVDLTGGTGGVKDTMTGTILRAPNRGSIELHQRLLGRSSTIDERYSGRTFWVSASGIPDASQLTDRPWLKYDVNSTLDQLGLGGLPNGSSDPTEFLTYLKAVGGRAHALGTAQIDGVQTTHYAATVDLDRYPEVLPAARRAPARRAVRRLIATLGSHRLQVQVWIDGHHLTRRMAMSFPECVSREHLHVAMVVDLSDFGTQANVTLPSASRSYDITPLVNQALAHQQLGCTTPS